MSQITAGAVVDVATNRGLYPVIVASIDGDSFDGYRVSPREHHVVIDAHHGLLDEVIIEHEERAAVIQASAGEGGAVVFNDEDGIRVYSIGHERNGTSAKNVAGALSVACRVLAEIGEERQTADIRKSIKVYSGYLSTLLNTK